jgi:hypothetical protein
VPPTFYPPVAHHGPVTKHRGWCKHRAVIECSDDSSADGRRDTGISVRLQVILNHPQQLLLLVCLSLSAPAQLRASGVASMTRNPSQSLQQMVAVAAQRQKKADRDKSVDQRAGTTEQPLTKLDGNELNVVSSGAVFVCGDLGH